MKEKVWVFIHVPVAQPRSFSVFLPHYIISVWTASKLLIDTQPEKPEKTIGQLPCLTAGEVLLIVFWFFYPHFKPNIPLLIMAYFKAI